MAGALVAHGVVAHLVDDHFQQVQRTAGTGLVVVDEHQTVVGTVAELRRPRRIVERLYLFALLRFRWMYHHGHEQSRAVCKEFYLRQHVTDLHGVALGPVRQLDVVEGVEQQLPDAVAPLQLFGPVEQFVDGAPRLLGEEEDILFEPVKDALRHGLWDGRAPVQGDIIIPNYNCAGLFIFQHWDELSQEQVYSIFYLDKMLELIREMMQRLPATECHPACGHPTPERDMNLENRIKKCISLLMAERYGDEPLFNIQGHWQAVYRILVDKGYCRDSDFDGFDTFIQRVMPDKVNKPYKKDSVKSISQTDFALPFERWHYDPQTSTTRKPYDRMVSIAIRFKQILEEKGL